jgi:hypothetical protein
MLIQIKISRNNEIEITAIRRESHVTGRCLARIKHTTHEHGVELERRVSAVRGRNIGINKGLKASQFKQCN